RRAEQGRGRPRVADGEGVQGEVPDPPGSRPGASARGVFVLPRGPRPQLVGDPVLRRVPARRHVRVRRPVPDGRLGRSGEPERARDPEQVTALALGTLAARGRPYATRRLDGRFWGALVGTPARAREKMSAEERASTASIALPDSTSGRGQHLSELR